MSSIDARVNSKLRSSTALVALVGSEIRTVQGDSTGDVLLATITQTAAEENMGGTIAVVESLLQTSSLSKKFLSAHQIAAEVRKTLERWVDTTGGVRDTLLDDENHLFDGEWYEILQDYTIYHTT